MSTDTHIIASRDITARIKVAGAELCSLKNAEGLELLWQAGPEWPRHAPLLFPIVGRLKNDELRHKGKTYPMTQHGFARDQRFEWVSREAASCKLVLVDSEATRARYPFAFRLEVTYAVQGADLEVTFEIANPGTETLPASLGGHPAFGWPLLPGLAKEAYKLSFSHDEPAPIRRPEGGLTRPDAQPSPIKDRTLALSERLFEDDAVIIDQLASTSVRYAADRGPSIEFSWDGFRELGIWSKPGGASFLCIEPWHGFASPVDFDGEFTDKPGLMQIAPGASRSLSYRIRVAS
ncbi:aldose 1-epimerase family protein [Bradyrhizobium cenepequi]|uniref:aldose 1-epimerase family protein n=1 Tax=Bradyrhizobium cenepequi TaxID=2821403 RepID=UPI001CE36D8C|nr:aldose 1-epimerase family protein [Bradyrhizobium cenepequi]MCA6106789.1 aldose 1-epimerase family protein [Bradyrhizobium cenepequi]